MTDTREQKSQPVTLDVGGRQFRTLSSTLTTQSPYFEALLSDRWNNIEIDGSYFIDADPDLFQFILQYLRRGMYPFLYDKQQGFDIVKYQAIQHEAEYFQVEKLATWIKDKGYKRGVSSVYKAQMCNYYDEAPFENRFPPPSHPCTVKTRDVMVNFINEYGLEDVTVETVTFGVEGYFVGYQVGGRSVTIEPDVFKAE